jgi:hypothetical protein
MIRYIERCMNQKKLSEHKWDGHFAFMHFKELKGMFVNGKPLKWHYRFKNGDVVERITHPYDPITAFFATVGAFIGAHAVAFTVGALAVGAGLTVALVAAGSKPNISPGGTKEYESSSNPEIKGANNSISDGIIPYVFGKTQQTANYGQTPYKRIVDGSSTNKYLQYFVSNYDNVVYSDYKLGDTLVNNYSVDYVNIDTSYGGSTFIGFDNVKAVNRDEQLSYNAYEEVQQTASHTYSQATTSTSLQIDFVVRFTNVDILNWANKEFRLTANIIDDLLASQELTEDFTIEVGDLNPVTGETDVYTYNGTKTWVMPTGTNITELTDTSFQPLIYTRGNSTEVTNELDSIYYSEDITTDDYSNSLTLNQSVNYYQGTTSEILETSPDGTTEIDIILSFPQGLYTQESDGSRSARSAIIDIEYKGSSDSDWNAISDANALYVRDIDGVKQSVATSTTTVDGSKVTVYSPPDLADADQLFYRTIGMELDSDVYAVRVRSADFADKTNFDIGVPYVNEIHFYNEEDVLDINILPYVNQIAFEATAYKGLSGTLKKFNYIAEAEIPIWNGTDWNTTDKTTNPAAIIRDLLTNPIVNPRAEDVSTLDNDSLTALYEFCEDEGYKASGIVSDQMKIGEVLDNILSNCQATMIPLYDGNHTFVIDTDDKTSIGLFNQHNSWGFKWSPNIGRQTEAIRASFINNETYTQDELTVYYYNGSVSETPETGTTDDDYEIIKKDYKFVNDRASVLKIATYELTNIQEKRNYFEFNVNLEGINLRLYDRCYISNTTNMQNESSGLIKSVNTSGGNLTGFTLYSEIDIPENSKIVIRSLDYDNEQPAITIYDVTNSGSSDIVNITSVVYNGVIKGQGNITGIQDTWWYDGDLFTIGQDTIHDCLIIGIKYNEDNTATITARDY